MRHMDNDTNETIDAGLVHVPVTDLAAPTSTERTPAAVYLASLGSEKSRRATTLSGRCRSCGGMTPTGSGSLLGVPIVLIGHTAKQAWSHTVSTSWPCTAKPWVRGLPEVSRSMA